MIFKNFTKSVEEIKKVLKIRTEVLGVEYSGKSIENGICCRDTACTAISRSFGRKKRVVIKKWSHAQLCSGGDYFLKIKDISDEEAIGVYVDTEKVFESNDTCKMFLGSLPEFPDSLKTKNIIIGPLRMMNDALVVIFLVTPAQAGRIIGLLNYKKYSEIKIIPGQPTCISLFAPLVAGQPHVNFIDYYDRYYQGIVRGKKIWPDGKMIVSMTLAQFEEACDNLHKSPHGSFVPELHPRRVDCI